MPQFTFRGVAKPVSSERVRATRSAVTAFLFLNAFSTEVCTAQKRRGSREAGNVGPCGAHGAGRRRRGSLERGLVKPTLRVVRHGPGLPTSSLRSDLE